MVLYSKSRTENRQTLEYFFRGVQQLSCFHELRQSVLYKTCLISACIPDTIFTIIHFTAVNIFFTLNFSPENVSGFEFVSGKTEPIKHCTIWKTNQATSNYILMIPAREFIVLI